MGKGKHKNRHVTTELSAIAEKRDSITAPFYLSSVAAIGSASYPLTMIEAVGVSAVRRCVTLIANSIAGRPWRELDGTRDLSPSRLVRRPAGIMTRREWAWRMIAEMALNDLAYVHMVGGVDDEGVPGSLIPIPNGAITPEGPMDAWGIFPARSFRISGVEGTVSGEAVGQVRSAFWPGVPPHLVGVLRMARDTMMSVRSAEAYTARYWQAGGAPTTILKTDQWLDDTQADDAGNRWRNRRAMGPDFPAVLGMGLDAKEWGADLAKQSGQEARRAMVADVGNLFGVNVRYLNANIEGSSMTYSNLQDEAVSLDRYTLAGFYEPLQDLITDLLPDPRRMEIDTTAITQGSQESRYRAWQIATGKPWMDAEEVRAKEGLPPGAPEPDPSPAPASPSGAGDPSEKVGANAP